MFFLRLLAVFAIFASATAVPVTETEKESIAEPVTAVTENNFDDDDKDKDDDFLESSPLIDDIFNPLFKALQISSATQPRIIADDEKFQVVVCVKDYKKDDLKVNVKKNDIIIMGSYENKEDELNVIANQFFYDYTLRNNSNGADVTAELTSDGYLVITAPVNVSVDKAKEVDIEVPIVETGKPFDENKPEDVTPKASETTIAKEEATKQETTSTSDDEKETEDDDQD